MWISIISLSQPRWWHSISSPSSTLNRLWDCLNNDFVVTMIVSCLVIFTPQPRMPQQALRRYADDVCRQMMSLRDELSPIYSSTLYVIVCITSSEISLFLRPKTMMILQKISCLMTLTHIVCVSSRSEQEVCTMCRFMIHQPGREERRRWNNFVVSLCAAKWDYEKGEWVGWNGKQTAAKSIYTHQVNNE